MVLSTGLKVVPDCSPLEVSYVRVYVGGRARNTCTDCTISGLCASPAAFACVSYAC